MKKKLSPINLDIIFEFCDNIEDGKLKDESSVIIVKTQMEDQRKPRMVKVLEVGPDVTNVSVGDTVYVEPLQWSVGCDLPSEVCECTELPKVVWKTDETKIIAKVEE